MKALDFLGVGLLAVGAGIITSKIGGLFRIGTAPAAPPPPQRAMTFEEAMRVATGVGVEFSSTQFTEAGEYAAAVEAQRSFAGSLAGAAGAGGVLVQGLRITENALAIMLAAGMTEFQIANGYGNVGVGWTVTINGKTFINTGRGYASFNDNYYSAIQYVRSLGRTILIERLIASGYATPSQLDAMTDDELYIYAGAVKANGASL